VNGARFGDVLKDRKVVVTYEDIADKKKAYLQLLQNEKMASIGQLAAGVAHEINNPTAFVSSNLKSLCGYVEDITAVLELYRELSDALRNGKGKANGQIADRLHRIESLEKDKDIQFILSDITSLISESSEGATRISRIVQDLKNFAHPGDEKLKPVDLNKNIDSTLNVVWNEIKYKAIVYKDYGKLPDIPCYPQQLNQVFMNILVNAAHAISDKGEIRIATLTSNGSVEIKISDTGSGIPRENLPKLFDPFFTTKEVGKGTGLGLHVAYDIVKKHHGMIDVESTVGRGTTFTIRLPLSQDLH